MTLISVAWLYFWFSLIRHYKSAGWNNLSIPKLQRFRRWSLGMDRWFTPHVTEYMWFNVRLKFPKLQRLHRWSLGMDKCFHSTRYWVCDYLFMLIFKLIKRTLRGKGYFRAYIRDTLEVPTICTVSQDKSLTWSITLIARFMWPTWGTSGADRTQVGPCWPHELCYLGTSDLRVAIPVWL